MRWIFLTCIILLATTTNVLSGHRTKRDFDYIKNLIVEKLFGRETILIQQPEIPKNETYQLFKIKGYDDILLKVTKKAKNKTEETLNKKLQDPVIVSPEIAIIGSYLGTTTQGQTLLAIEIVKNMIKSGILNSETDKLIQKLASPISDDLPHKNKNHYYHIKPVNEFVEENYPYYELPLQAEGITIGNRDSVAAALEYPTLAVVSEVKTKPAQATYSYTQKGETADMKYESYNNKDVVVTRTNKEPPLPQNIKLRFAELVSNQYTMQPQQPEHFVNIVSNSNLFNPPMVSQEIIQANVIPAYVMGRYPAVNTKFGIVDDSNHVFVNNVNSPTIAANKIPAISSQSAVQPNFIEKSNSTFDMRNHLTDSEIDKINKYINNKLDQSKITHNIVSQNNSSRDSVADNETNISEKDNKITGNNGGIVSLYVYKQINHNSRDNFTVVKVEDPINIKQADPQTDDVGNSGSDDIKDFVFMPPKDIDIPLPNMIPKTNNINQNKDNEEISPIAVNSPKPISDKTANIQEKSEVTLNDGSLKTSVQNSLKNDPIIVQENKSDENKDRLNKFRGRKPYKPFNGGPIF